MKKNLNLRQTLILIGVIAALLIAMNFFGIGTFRSATRMGYVESAGLRSWSASYSLLSGTMRHTIRPKNTPERLLVESETKDGVLSIQIADADGNVLFFEEDMGTSSYEVEIPGRVAVTVKGSGHRGSFRIEPME